MQAVSPMMLIRRASSRSAGRAAVAGLAITLLAACGSPAPPTGQPLDEPPTRTPHPTSTPTDEPTPTGTPRPTRTPLPTPGPGLEELLGTPNALAAAAYLQQAEDAFEDLADLYPHRAEPWLGLAGIALREGDSDAALEYLESAAEADPASFEALSQWALLLEQLARYDEAIAVYDAMIAQAPDNPDLLVARAIAWARLGEAQQSAADLQATDRLDPYRQYVWLNAAAAASGERHYEAAIEIATAGLDAHPDSVSLYLERGMALLSVGEPEAAVDDFDAAIDLDDQNYSAYRWRGRTLGDLGRTEQAIADLQQAAELGVNAGVGGVNESYLAMADTADLLAQSGKVEEAFSYLASQVVTHGSQDALLMGYARIDWRRGNIGLAVGRLDALVRDGYVPALYWRGAIHASEGNTDQAIDDLRAFLAVRTSGPDAEAARALLESLGADPDNVGS